VCLKHPVFLSFFLSHFFLLGAAFFLVLLSSWYFSLDTLITVLQRFNNCCQLLSCMYAYLRDHSHVLTRVQLLDPRAD
jgi:hypothetical protein